MWKTQPIEETNTHVNGLGSEERLEFVQRQGAGAVALGFGWIGMGFQKEARDALAHAGPH